MVKRQCEGKNTLPCDHSAFLFLASLRNRRTLLHGSRVVAFRSPCLEKSRINARLIHDIINLEGIMFLDLYETYPDFFIDGAREQQR